MKTPMVTVTAGLILLGAMPGLLHAAHAPGELLVKTNPNNTSAESAAFETTLRELDAKIEYRYRLVPGLKRVKVDKAKQGVALKQLQNLNGVEYAVPNHLREIQGRPSHPSSRSGGGGNPGPKKDPPILAPIDRPVKWVEDTQWWGNYSVAQNLTREAWEKYDFRGSPGTVIAVIDTGVDYTHRDLQANMWRNSKEGAMPDGIDNDGNGLVDDIYGYDFFGNDNLPWDDHGHGTHVAGLAAAVGGNGYGIQGQCPGCSIMALRFIGKDGGTDADAIRAIEYAVANGAHVINSSWGGTEESPALKDAFRASSEAGVLNAVAAGNDGEDLDLANQFPAKYQFPGMLTVAALFETNIYIPQWSNYSRNFVHISSGGVQIPSTIPGDKFESWSGTSMASPNVAGCMALIKGYRPDLNHAEVVELLRNVSPDKDSIFKTVFRGRPDMLKIFSELQ